MSNLLSKCACILTKNHLHKFKVQLQFQCSVICETTANNENILKQWASFYINIIKDKSSIKNTNEYHKVTYSKYSILIIRFYDLHISFMY